MREVFSVGVARAAGSGTIARSTRSGDAIELLQIQPVREYIGDKEAAEVGFPFWTASFVWPGGLGRFFACPDGAVAER